MTTNAFENWQHLDNQALLDLWLSFKVTEDSYREDRERLEFELTQRMQVDDATAIPHETLDVKLVTPSPTYDVGRLRAIAELVPPEEWAKGFTAAHWGEPVWVEDKYNLTKIKPLAKYGAAVAQVIADAAIPGPVRLVIKRKALKTEGR